MLRRYAVEIYFTGFALAMLGALALTLHAILEQREAAGLVVVLVVLGCVLGLMAMIAADVRQRSLPIR